MSTTAANNDKATQQKIVEGFQKMREEQQQLIQEIARVEADIREHSTVLKTIEEMAPGRKCFRQVGDTLVQYTIAEIIEILKVNLENLQNLLTTQTEKLTSKGKDLNAYKEKHNIRLLSEQEVLEIQKKQALAKVSAPPSNAIKK
uniref:Prefoldin subunit 2 n=2 Tax=Acrobeloides nanus TaxID=290746 RepID=A0A914BV87_9BILA